MPHLLGPRFITHPLINRTVLYPREIKLPRSSARLFISDTSLKTLSAKLGFLDQILIAWDAIFRSTSERLGGAHRAEV